MLDTFSGRRSGDRLGKIQITTLSSLLLFSRPEMFNRIFCDDGNVLYL